MACRVQIHHHPADVTDREAAGDCGSAAGASYLSRRYGGKSVGIFLALALLITLCVSANAATAHHSRPRHVIVSPGQPVIPGFAGPTQSGDPRRPPVLQDQTPELQRSVQVWRRVICCRIDIAHSIGVSAVCFQSSSTINLAERRRHICRRSPRTISVHWIAYRLGATLIAFLRRKGGKWPRRYAKLFA